MARRPTKMPLFASDAAGGAIVETPEAVRLAGFAANDRPPAPWMNYQLHEVGNWLNFLRGPSFANWERSVWGLTTFDTTKAILCAYDGDTLESAGRAIRRYVAAGTVSGNPKLRVSKRGTSWQDRAVVGASAIGEIHALCWTGGDWLLGTDDAGTGKIWSADPSDGQDAASTSPIDDATENWIAATMPGATTAILAFAYESQAKIAAICVSKIIYSVDAAGSFANATMSGAPAGLFLDVCWTGVAYVAVTGDGEVYRATDIAGTWTNLGVILTAATDWQVEAGADGVVLAWIRTTSGAGADWFISGDHGATWAAFTAPGVADLGVRQISYLDGAWLMALDDVAPYLAQSNTPDATDWTRLPIPITEGSAHIVNDITYGEGAFVAVGATYNFLSQRGEDLSPEPWTPATGPATQSDAAYLRGYLVSDAPAPSNRDTLAWNAATSRFVFSVCPADVIVREEYKTSDGATKTVSATTLYMGVTKNTAGKTITLPANVDGRRVEISDEVADAAANNITIQPPSGLINGAASVTITADRGTRRFTGDGTNWHATTTH